MSEQTRPPLSLFVGDTVGLALGQARVFRFRRRQRTIEGFVLREASGLVAYANECPHWHVDLDLGMGEFWDEQTGKILCKNHGALFDAASGICELGPCVGLALERFALCPERDGVWVEIADAEPPEPR
jgi:nitrite reductase/ring-hydroxylating ferredoxin subunit